MTLFALRIVHGVGGGRSDTDGDADYERTIDVEVVVFDRRFAVDVWLFGRLVR